MQLEVELLLIDDERSVEGVVIMATNLKSFDPQAWLDEFETVGGGWIVRDCPSLAILVEGRTDDELSWARQLVVDLTPERREAVVAHLRARDAALSGEA